MMYLKKRILAKTSRGFSIAEVMFAAFVLTIGLLAIVALIANSLQNALETRDTIIAVELAQEGVELVRNVRDNDFAAGGDGFAGFLNDTHCRIDYNDAADSLDCGPSVGSASRYSLQYDNNFYEHGSGSGRFSRYIYIDYDDMGQKNALVRSFAYWGGDFTPPDTGGSAANCTVADKCVFTEIKLTSWK